MIMVLYAKTKLGVSDVDVVFSAMEEVLNFGSFRKID